MGFFRGAIEQRSINGYTNQEFMRLLNINTGSVDTNKLGEITYFTCMKLLSESVAKLPLKLYRETEDGVKKATDHYLYSLMKSRPNQYQSSWNFWTTVEMLKNHEGNAYVYADIKKGKAQGLYILPSNSVTIWVDNAGIIGRDNAIWYVYRDKHGNESKMTHHQVLHFKSSVSLDGITGLSVQDCLNTTIENAQSGQKFVNNYWKNGLMAKGLLQYTGDIEESKRKIMQSKFESMASGIANAGRILPVPLGFSFQSLNTSMVDSQFLELNKYTALQIAGAFGIKPNQINNYDKATFSNVEFEQTSFYVDTLLTILTMYEQEMTYKLLTETERRQGYFFKFNVDAILRADFKTRMEAYAIAINNGVMSPNEVRRKEDMPDDTDGDKLIVNGNYIPLSMVGEQYVKGGDGKNGS
ncbi:phage portal protein [Paenibacillus sp. NPDC093718]|uniref:phage portal protein n=1 Tax=Paenibacillus sp. NPDC093718 TaxID=3390601 RepID=UPI003CFDD73C